MTTTMNYEVLLGWLGTALIVVMLFRMERERARTRGIILQHHLIYVTFMAACHYILPDVVKLSIFSPLGVAVVGTVYPIYETINAVCTVEETDDKIWIQYWIAQGVMDYSTEWVDDIATRNEIVREYWYEFLFFYYIWLLLPQTDGMTLIFDKVTKPRLSPYVEPLAKRCDGWLSSVVATVVSASHLWILWATFVFLNPALKRFITVSVGFVYPLMASVVAATTPSSEDDTFWLTYWSCFESLFLIMKILERWLGKVPGFYSIVIFSAVYLMVPMFNGADKVFRNILVPVAQLQESLLLRDSHILKKEIIKTIPVSRAKELRELIAASFIDDDNASEEGKSLLVSATYQSTGTNEVHPEP